MVWHGLMVGGGDGTDDNDNLMVALSIISGALLSPSESHYTAEK